MVKSLFTGVSGMKTHQQKLDVIGNNIANVNTDGYKTNVVTFADVYYQTKKSPSGATPTRGGTNPIQVGYGVKMNTTSPNMTQSGFKFTDNIYDMALDGEGFFQLMDSSGNILYTRAGIFDVDEEGNLVHKGTGYRVLGVSGDFDGQPAGSQPIKITIPATDDHCSSATKTINGCDVTIAVSDPSDNTDMSVTFNDAEYPFATYSGGVLNLFFNRDQQFDSAQMFEDEIAKCLKAGGVTLPDDVSIKFTFENLPASTTAVAAKASVDSWTHTLDQASVENRVDVSAGQDGSSYATIAFATNNANTANKYNEATIAVTEGTETTATYDQGNNAWAITIAENTRQSDLTQEIKDAIATAKAADTTGKLAGLNLSVTKFEIPAGTLKTAVGNWGSLTLVNQDPMVSGITATMDQPGEYANSYKVVFKYVSNYDAPTAQWDENTLTIGITNKAYADDVAALADINAAISAAAGGNAKKIFEFDPGSFTGLAALNPGRRKALFEDNPSLSFGGGEDSFYTTVAKSLSTFNLTDGRIGAEQSYKNMKKVEVYQDGTIVGYHSILGYMNLGRIDIAIFDNPNGLDAVGGTMFAETVASGPVQVVTAGTDGAGEVVSGALEMSNVDLAQEFTDMITTQRGYQANSRVITTSDTMLEELLSLKR